MYSLHDTFGGESKRRNSLSAQWTGAPARVVANRPLVTYWKGLTLYMKIQKPGNSLGVAITLERVC